MTTGRRLDRGGRVHAATHLRRLIVDGVLTPGELLSEPELAEQLGVSRTPIREALVTLTAEGLAVKLSSNRTIVATVSLEEVGHVYDIRARLEGLIARDAALRVTDDDRAALERLVSLMERLRDDAEEVGRVGASFHEHLRTMSENRLASSMLHTLRAHVDRYRPLTTRAPGRASDAVGEHREICDAVLAGDADLADRLMVEHVERARAIALVLPGVAGE